MKRRSRLTLLLVLFGVLFGAIPAFAGWEMEGNPWDVFVDTSSFTGTKLSGPLSIYYSPLDPPSFCNNGQPYVDMYYTVRLIKGTMIYTFDGETRHVCFGDIGTPDTNGQGKAITDFLGSVVMRLFPNAKGWKLKSITQAKTAESYLAWVADIAIAVRE